jgi:hypothetical protein
MATPFGYPLELTAVLPVRERRCSVMIRIKGLFIVLGLLALAALNGATPWGP